jgi:spore coat polysaccharide biosynthesis predicted glycosyltransferase SpsG
MRYVLRADASRSMGAGHVMRSSAIAEELIARGKDVIFVGQITDLPWVEERIACLGFSKIYIKSMEFHSNPESDVLILDSYTIQTSESFIDQKNWRHIVAIVDEITPEYNCTIRIHPGLDKNWTGSSETPILAGPKYIPIRASLSRNSLIRNEGNKTPKIAVVAGGSDPYELVNEVARVLTKTTTHFEAYLFSGTDNHSIIDPRFHYIQIGQKLDDLTKGIDLVLTTASTSSLEFLARGICVGLVCAIDNQQQYYDSLGSLGVAAQLGFRTSRNNWALDEQLINSLIKSSELRANLMTKAAGLIDFNGASRIVDVITSL